VGPPWDGVGVYLKYVTLESGFGDDGMSQVIVIEPLGAGWSVHSQPIENDMVFCSGEAAERAARSLASRLSDAGHPVEIEIKLRTGVVQRVILY
jgi:hypothetical protein